MHNYRSNQSALMTRFGTDLRHQYGIFGGESQTSFTRNATRAGSEEGRLFSQASFWGNQHFYVLSLEFYKQGKCIVFLLFEILAEFAFLRWCLVQILKKNTTNYVKLQ